MKKILISLLASIVLISTIGISSVNAEEDKIPTWVKGIFAYYVEDEIEDSELINALEFLIDNKVISLGDNIVVDSGMVTQEVLEEKLNEQFIKNHAEKTALSMEHQKLYAEVESDSEKKILEVIQKYSDAEKKNDGFEKRALKAESVRNQLNKTIEEYRNLNSQVQSEVRSLEGTITQLEAVIESLKNP